MSKGNNFQVPKRRVINPIIKLLKNARITNLTDLSIGWLDGDFDNGEATIIMKVKCAKQ